MQAGIFKNIQKNWTILLKKYLVWWVYLGWLPDAHPATLSLSLLSSMVGENKVENLLVQDKGREITYQLPSRPKQDQLGEN